MKADDVFRLQVKAAALQIDAAEGEASREPLRDALKALAEWAEPEADAVGRFRLVWGRKQQRGCVCVSVERASELTSWFTLYHRDLPQTSSTPACPTTSPAWRLMFSRRFVLFGEEDKCEYNCPDFSDAHSLFDAVGNNHSMAQPWARSDWLCRRRCTRRSVCSPLAFLLYFPQRPRCLLTCALLLIMWHAGCIQFTGWEELLLPSNKLVEFPLAPPLFT